MSIDWQAVVTGVALGVPMSLLFFSGLAWSVQLALRSPRPGVLLLLSFAFRTALLLAVGYWLLSTGDNAWSMAGYLLAFVLARVAAVLWARTARTYANAEQEQG